MSSCGCHFAASFTRVRLRSESVTLATLLCYTYKKHRSDWHEIPPAFNTHTPVSNIQASNMFIQSASFTKSAILIHTHRSYSLSSFHQPPSIIISWAPFSPHNPPPITVLNRTSISKRLTVPTNPRSGNHTSSHSRSQAHTKRIGGAVLVLRSRFSGQRNVSAQGIDGERGARQL